MGEAINAVVFFLIIVWGVQSCEGPKEQLTVYPIVCKTPGPNEKCLRWSALGRWHVRARTQVVTLLRDDGALWRLANCTVYDAQNWSCDELATIDGEVNGGLFDPLRYVSFWRWAPLRVRSLLDEPPKKESR